MSSAWPSHLRCATGSGDMRILHLHLLDGYVRYYAAGGSANIDFNTNGSFKSHSYASTCANKSIKQLLAEGSAYY